MDFLQVFKALTDYEPLRWQERLYIQIRAGRLPDVCDLPTGLGKTSVIPIWLIAFASEIESGQSAKLPRRLIYIVNRRTVVDQATDLARKLRERIEEQNGKASDPSSPLGWLKTTLAQARANSSGPVLAISTLRGELADNEEWKLDPARPAIVVGTIDMVGSKLLFSGYGDGEYHRPHHAGLIGQDTLIIHDEAHLARPFSQLLQAVEKEQCQGRDPRPVSVLELSATVTDTRDRRVFGLTREDHKDDLVRLRLGARKALYLHTSEGPDPVAQLVALALAHQEAVCRVLMYVRSPETALKVLKQLKQALGAGADKRVALLTGTIRGQERDDLVKSHPVYQAMLHHDQPLAQTVYLVSTSAGEVGIDLDSDHLVCDLTTLEAMVQRLGRVNRRGGKGRVAQVDVVAEVPGAKDPLAEPVANTRLALERLPHLDTGGHDASPLALRELMAGAQGAFAPQPGVLPLTDILLDGWALTSLSERLPGQPPVAPYLHGLEENLAETTVAWRAELPLLAQAGLDDEDLREWFQHCRVEARERARDATYRVWKVLQALADRQPETPCVVLSERGEAHQWRLGELAAERMGAIAFKSVVLPVGVGGLTDEGLLDGSAAGQVPDVAEAGGTRERWLIEGTQDSYRARRLRAGVADAAALPDTGELVATPRQAAAQIARRRKWSTAALVPLTGEPEGDDPEAEERYLLLVVEPRRAAREAAETAGQERPPTVAEHCWLAEQWAGRLADRLGLEPALCQALTEAARLHDVGKARPTWQRAIYNDEATPYAKSGPRGMDWRRLEGYRHEFGSLLDAAGGALAGLAEADLALHLIAAHHGWARPHFRSRAWDTEHTTAENAAAALEAMRRYARQQQRWGRWGLAWLETLLRCADLLASQQVALPQAPEEEQA